MHALTRKITQTSKCETQVDTKNNHFTVAENKPNCPINMEYPVSRHVLASVCNGSDKKKIHERFFSLA